MSHTNLLAKPVDYCGEFHVAQDNKNKHMKKIFLITAIFFAGHICEAQLTTTLVVVPQPPGALINWGTKELTYIISNQAGSAIRNFVVKAELKESNGTVVATTNLAKARVRTLGPATLILYAADVIPLEVMVFTGKYKTSLERTGKLPAGNYELCLQLVTPIDFLPVSEIRCRNFTLAAFQLPIPTMPGNEEVLDAEKAQTAIMFRWTPVAPRPSELVKYIVTVFEILDKQTPMQALRSNQPLLTKEVIGTTQYIWQPQLSFAKTKIWTDDAQADSLYSKEDKAVMDSVDANTFIWTIQTVDSRGVPFGDGNVNSDGISEPNTFTVIRDRRKIKTGPPSRIIYLNSMKNRRN